MPYEHVPPQKVWFCGVPENVAFYDLFECCKSFFENDTLGSEIGSGFRELGAKSAQPRPQGFSLKKWVGKSPGDKVEECPAPAPRDETCKLQ